MTFKRYLRAASLGACLTLTCSLALADELPGSWR